MVVIDVNSLPTHAKEYSDNKHIVRRDELKISLVNVRRGSSIPAHVHEEEEQFYYVLQGEGNLRLAEEAHALRPGVAVCIPRGVCHGVANPNDMPLEFLDILIAKRHKEGEHA